MTMDIATLGIRIDSIEARQRLQELERAGDGTTRSLTATERASQRAGSQFNAMAGMAKVAAGAIAGIAFAKSIQEIASFETKLLSLKALTNANTSQMKEMEKQARSLGATTAFSAQQTAEAQGVLASAGLKVNEILAATPKVLELAAAGALDLAKAAEISTGTMKGLGLELTDLGRINDVFAKVAADTSTNVEQVGEAMKNVAPIAKAFGINLEDMGASIGVLADNQIKGSEAGNNFKAMLVALGNETKDKTELLKQHGLSFADLNIQVNGLQPVMDTLRKANLSGAEAITLFGSDAAAAGLILASNAGKIDTFSTALEGAAGSAKKQSDILNQGLAKAWDALLGTLSEAALQFGDVQNNSHTLTEELTGLITSVTGVIAIYEGMGKEFAASNNLTKEQYTNLKNVASGLETVASAVGGIALLTAGIWAANTAMLAFNLASRANPLVLVATLGAAGIGMVIDKIGQQKKAQEEFMTSANTLEEQNLKIKEQSAKIERLTPHGNGTGASKETMEMERMNLNILLDQKRAIEAKTAAEKEAAKLTGGANKSTATEPPKPPAITKPPVDEAAEKAAEKLRKDNLKTISDELKSLDEQHKKLTLSERDYYAQSDALKLMSVSQKAFAMAQWDANKALDAQKKSSETAKTELAALKDKYDQLTLSASAYYASSLDKQKLTPEQAAPLIKQNDSNIQAEAAKKTTDDATASLDAYNKKLDDANTKTSDLGAVTSAIFDGALAGINGMAGAFDTMVNSIASSTKALEENAAMQKANESEKDPDKQSANSKKYATEEINLNNKVLTDKLKAGSQIAGFLSSSLKKGSTEQRAAHAIQMGLAGAELAMNIAKMMGIDLLTMKEIASVGPSVAASKIKGTAKASEAVATQASAGPYIGFALMAAMVVAMAAIGFATGGGGGGAASGPPPSNSDMGTGTVLGDPTAKSESIKNTNDLLQNIHAEEYLELRGINKGVQALSGSILSAITKQFQLGAIQGVNAPNLGKSGHTMVAGGLQTGEITLGDLLKGNNVFGQMYTTDAKKGGTKEKPTYKYTDYLSPMAAELQKSLTDVFKNIGATFKEVSTKLGPEFAKKINAAIIPALKIDTMGLSGKDAVEKANAVISSMMDNVSAVVFSSLLKYQQLGEGMYETAVRIESEKAIIKDAFAQSGKAMPKVATDAIAMADALVQASGGLEKFQASFAAFMDKFTTDAEKQTRTDKYLKGAFKENKLFNGTQIKGMLSSRDAYGDAVDAAAADVSKYAGKKGKKNIAAEKAAVTQYALLLEMAPKVDEYLSYNETLAKDKFELDNTLMKSQGRTAEALAASRKKELDAMEPSLRAIKAQIYAIDDLNAAIKTSLSKMTELSNKLKTALKSTTVESKASLSIDRANANALLKSTLIIAKMGGAIENIAGMDKALADVAKPSEQLYSTFEDYARDQAITSSTISELAGFADAQISMAQKQLDATNNTTTAVAGLPDAIASLMGLVAQKKALTPQFASGGFHSGGWRVVGENGPELEQTGASRIFSNGQSKSLLSMDELIAEIQALRADARANAAAVAKNTAETSRIINRWDGDGMPAVRTTV